MQIVLPIKLRACQSLILRELKKYHYFVAVCHRGMGKTYFAMAWLIMESLKAKGKYAYIAPELKQAKKVIWDEFKGFLGQIPGSEFNEAELRAKLPNGSMIYLEGAEKPDRIRGNHYKAVVLDEVGDMPYDMWELVVFPALQANNGRAFFIGTPKGKNKFFELFQNSEIKSRWGSLLLDLYTSQAFDEERIKAIEEEYMGREAEFAQEYLCRWDAQLGLDAAYYGRLLNYLSEKGQMISYGVDPLIPVYVGIDLGVVDKTVIWFAQNITRENRIVLIDYYENNNKDLTHYIQYLKSKPYIYAKIFLPHDSAARKMNQFETPYDVFKTMGFNVDRIPKTHNTEALNQEIGKVKSMLNRCWFNTPITSLGLDGLREYKAATDRITGAVTDKPKHNDVADAFRYLLLGLEKEGKKEVTRSLNSALKDAVIRQDPLRRFKEGNRRHDNRWLQ